jgi:5-methyltetrahydropteroyltriglutamate--homocysteine methyltransferase
VKSAPDVLPTAVVGSYPQPEWLVDRSLLTKLMAPRVRAEQIWRIAPEFLEEAQNDATIVAIRDQERAGIDIITDGEIRRESYSNRFANALLGIDHERPAEIVGRIGKRIRVPRVVGPVSRPKPVEVRDVEFLRANTSRRIKITLPGPFTMAQQALNEYYSDEGSLALAYAEAVNAEVRDLFAAGADIVQLDEPWLESRPEKAREFGVAAVNRALAGASGTTALHLCFGYAAIVKDKPSSGYSFLAELEGCAAEQISIEAAQPKLDLRVLEQLPSKTVLVGVLDLGDPAVEPAELVAARLRRALEVVPPERLIAAPDCGMKYLARETAFAKLCALAAGTAIVRSEL